MQLVRSLPVRKKTKEKERIKKKRGTNIGKIKDFFFKLAQ
jgi:hypothetical protein